jgi:NADH:ubiquinone oxidoreductase subunit F (NADH-binding)
VELCAYGRTVRRAQKYLIANAAGMKPGTFNDRLLVVDLSP